MRFAYTQYDGRLAIVIAAPKADLEKLFGELTDDEFRNIVIERGIPAGVPYVQLADDWTPPEGRAWRDAWRMDADGRMHVCMHACRAIHLARLRRQRGPRLADLDIAELQAIASSMRDIEDGRTAFLSPQAREIAAMKQALRDAPADPRIAAAATPDDLASLTLDALVA